MDTNSLEQDPNTLTESELYELVVEMMDPNARQSALSRLQQVSTVDARERLYKALVRKVDEDYRSRGDECLEDPEIDEICHIIGRGGIHSIDQKREALIDKTTINAEREIIALVLGYQQDDSSYQALETFLSQELDGSYPSSSKVEIAIRAMGSQKRPERKEFLLGLLERGGTDAQVQIWAIEALANFPEPDVCRRLFELLEKEGAEADLCESIGETLESFPVQMTAFLRQRGERKERQERKDNRPPSDKYIEQIITIGGDISSVEDEILELPVSEQYEIVLRMLQHEDPLVLGCAFIILAINEYLDNPHLKPLILNHLRTNPSETFRARAAGVLGRYRDNETKSALLRVMEHDPSLEVRESAATTLSESFGFNR